VIYLNHVSEADPDGIRVIAYERDHQYHPFVVHYAKDEDADNRWQGSYVETADDARREFKRRRNQLDLGEVGRDAGREWFVGAGGTKHTF
jgi:hypothetical protein